MTPAPSIAYRPDAMLIRYLIATIEHARALFALWKDGSATIMWGVNSDADRNDYEVFETEGVILRPVTTGEARKFLVWTVPDSLRRNEVGLFLMTVRILPRDALEMIQMEPDHSDPVWEATKNNVLN